MGAGASVAEACKAATSEEVKAALSTLSVEDLKKIKAAIKGADIAKDTTPGLVAEVSSAIEKKSFKDWSDEDVASVLNIFVECDKDKSGLIEAGELKSVCASLKRESDLEAVDKFVVDGKVDSREFFAWHTGCSKFEAMSVFAKHDAAFDFVSKKAFKSWTDEDTQKIKDTFAEFDKDSSGFIDEAELTSLCKALNFQACMDDVDAYEKKLIEGKTRWRKDGKIDKIEFFMWFGGCTKEEATSALASA